MFSFKAFVFDTCLSTRQISDSGLIALVEIVPLDETRGGQRRGRLVPNCERSAFASSELGMGFGAPASYTAAQAAGEFAPGPRTIDWRLVAAEMKTPYASERPKTHDNDDQTAKAGAPGCRIGMA
jgi:hypothetical protein